MITDVTHVKNFHVASLIERLLDARANALRSETANSNDLLDADLERIRSYHGELNSFMEFVRSRPRLDAPHSHPYQFNIEFVGEETPTRVQNRSIRDLSRIYELTIKSLGESDSANIGSGIIEHDFVRFNKFMTQADALVAFMVEVKPLDKPETVPLHADVEQGSQNSAPRFAGTAS